MAVDTFPIRLSAGDGPVNIAAQPAVAAEFAAQGKSPLFVQSVGPGLVYLALQDDAPDPSVDAGHIMAPRDALVVAVKAASAIWMWTPTAATVAITEAI